MSRFARERRVFYFEEPVYEERDSAQLRSTTCAQTGVHVCTPVLPKNVSLAEIPAVERMLLEQMLDDESIGSYINWYYTPMARDFALNLKPRVTVYDCMDELSAFAGAPAAMKENERQLFTEADLVFTGGPSLFESKKKCHRSVHLFPSSVDLAHFMRGRSLENEPDDQRGIPHPRLGYAGVIDERMDLPLLQEVATARPDWHLVLLGPVVKIDESTLPRVPNIHYLGMRSYADLPAYFSGWNIGMLPFALNESTRFISPTKTPEYLAAGLPVISTPIRDVVTPYGDLGFVKIAGTAEQYVAAAESILACPATLDVQRRVDDFLSQSSWDKTWNQMNKLVTNSYLLKRRASAASIIAISTPVEQTEGVAHV